MQQRIQYLLYISLILLSCNQKAVVSSPLKYVVSDAPEWSKLFIREEGWFGGDGIFAIPMDRDTSRQLIIFSDTMLGKIKNGVLQKGYHMVNNSVAFLEGKKPDMDKITFPIPQDSANNDQSIFPVKLAEAEAGEYFWLGDGYYNSNTGDIHIFAYRVIDRPDSPDKFKFEILGGVVITIPSGSAFPFEDQHQTELPFFENDHGWITSFGAGILEDPNDGYIYIYGIRDPNKQVLVARVMPNDFQEYDTWRFWNGNDWVNDFKLAVAVADSASNELSVTRNEGKYLLIFQESGIYPTVGMRMADTPVGPFGDKISLWDCSEALQEKEFFTYNAKAHPTLSSPGQLIVSYNVNSFDFWNQIGDYPHLYRPRFFKLIFE